MHKVIMGIFLCLLVGCTSVYQNKSVIGLRFPAVSGQSLTEKRINIPEDFKGRKTLLLVGYKQNSQFDIDRWLIALDMTKTKVAVYEIPTIQGVLPGLFSSMIDNGMRNGIPKELWADVITVYKDGEKVQRFTGNEKPNNARVLLLDENGVILFSYYDGFSVVALNQLRGLLTAT